MTLASILILTGIACLIAGACLPIVYALRTRLEGGRRAPRTRARLVGATGAVGGMGQR